jgi:hypothetical protein
MRMSQFADRTFAALARFGAHLSQFEVRVAATPANPPRLPREALDGLLKIGARARAASDAIARSLTLIDRTALDIVDMQVRLQGETARLASALRELGQAVERQHFIRDEFDDWLVAVHEAAQGLAAAIFPGAVEGLREVNTRLWDFEKIEWKRYTDVLTEAVRQNRITPEQQAEIESIANSVAGAFAEVNTLLNDLAESRAADADALRRRLDQAPLRLTTTLQHAAERMAAAPKPLKAFAPVIKSSRNIADDVAKLLKELSIPVFPAHAALEACSQYISAGLYDSLSGVQTFAFLNILARLQETTASGRPLLADRRVSVFEVFADRVYMEADSSLIADIEADTDAFDQAPASLHRFKQGSFKQKTQSKGNLQVSFAARPNNRVVIDADIDLYPTPVRHLFGEVLVNHLTGSTTDQYKVRRILDEQKVAAIGGFRLLAMDLATA